MTELIFVSYRRQDAAAAHAAPRLAERLKSEFLEQGRDIEIFMDIESLAPGADIGRDIEDAIGRCSTLVAVIGKDWISVKNSRGTRRLDDPDDWVRREISAALTRKVRVAPVLLDGAPLPRAEELPDDLKALANRKAAVVNAETFRGNVSDLARTLAPARHSKRFAVRWSLAVGLGGLLAVSAWLGANVVWRDKPPPASYEVVAALLRQGKYDRAIALVRDETTSQGDLDAQSRTFSQLGYDLEQKGRLDEAILANLRALAFDKRNVFAHWNLGNELYAKHEYVAAEASHRAALEIDWGYTNAYYGLGNALMKLGRTAEAQEAFEKARDPTKRP